MQVISYFAFFILLLSFAFWVFRVIIRREYNSQGRLRWISSMLQLLVFAAFFCFPYLFNPPEWGLFWRIKTSRSPGLYGTGLILICLGFLAAFGTMAWFGIKRAFGIINEGVRKTGPYRLSRNPQILGCYLLVMGISLQWPSLYMIGWIFMYAIIMHWMVLTEEEHLRNVFGEEYQQYCQDTPRYLRIGKK
jgi:protein-S-isoprenylcysteine O-methyltransferase Ste14